MILLLLLWSKSENIRQTSEIEEVNSINRLFVNFLLLVQTISYVLKLKNKPPKKRFKVHHHSSQYRKPFHR